MNVNQVEFVFLKVLSPPSSNSMQICIEQNKILPSHGATCLLPWLLTNAALNLLKIFPNNSQSQLAHLLAKKNTDGNEFSSISTELIVKVLVTEDYLQSGAMSHSAWSHLALCRRHKLGLLVPRVDGLDSSWGSCASWLSSTPTWRGGWDSWPLPCITMSILQQDKTHWSLWHHPLGF